MRRAIVVGLFTLLAGCSTFSYYVPVPPGTNVPVAYVADTGSSTDGKKAQMFVLMEVDGKMVENGVTETRKASEGRGAYLSLRYTYRPLPIVPMKVKLVGTHQTAAPILEITSRAAGTFFSVEGVVDFTPVADARYSVKGELKAEGSSVWIEDSRTGQRVTDVVRSRP